MSQNIVICSFEQLTSLSCSLAIKHDGGENSTVSVMSICKITKEKCVFVAGNRILGIHTDGLKAKKEGKSLFLSKKVSDASRHRIDTHLDVCFLQAKVFPQTRLSEMPYVVWVSVSKTTGNIHNADCHCISGYSATFCDIL